MASRQRPDSPRRLQTAGQCGLDRAHVAPTVERFAGKEDGRTVRACERRLRPARFGRRVRISSACEGIVRQLIARAATRSRISSFGTRPKMSPSEASPALTSSCSLRRVIQSVFGPPNQPVSTGCSAGCCVHQTGIVASESRNVRSASSPRLSIHQRVSKRSQIFMTLPKPMCAAAAASSRSAGGTRVPDQVPRHHCTAF
jgi:hypothetical protein